MWPLYCEQRNNILTFVRFAAFTTSEYNRIWRSAQCLWSEFK